MLRQCLDRASRTNRDEVQETLPPGMPPLESRYGSPRLVAPRLGQGTFRVAVMDAYQRACAITGEHSLPALEAAHIRPYSREGEHAVSNGLLLRSDIHKLFDKGYVTVTPDFRFDVSSKLKEDFDNGHSYFPMKGKTIRVPERNIEQPERELLRWHSEEVFLG